MKKLMRKMRERKGFTLAELLIVVAIIAVLVAIAIPIFSAQLEKSKEATDMANVRAAYATIVAEHIQDGSAHEVSVAAKQKDTSWETTDGGQLEVMVNGAASTYTYNAKASGTSYKVSITDSGSLTVQ